MNANISKHCLERIKERLEKAGLSFSDIEEDLNRVLNLSYKNSSSYAVKVKDLGVFIGDETKGYYDRDMSNGQVLWLIVRDNYICTFFLRRKDQPAEAKKFSVDELL